MTSWPEDKIPLPLMDAVQGVTMQPIIASPLISGNILRRLRFQGNAPVGNFSIKWELTPGQFRSLRDFFSGSLNNGASSFTIYLRYPLTSALTLWLVKFDGQQLQAIFVEGIWEVTARWQLLYPYTFADPAPSVGTQGFLVQPDLANFYTSEGFVLYVKD